MAIVNECVGLDIGQTGLKAVRFRRRLSGRETIDYFHHPLPFARPEDLDPARRAQSLRGFLWKNGLYATDRLVTAIPCQDLFVRTLSFPFKDSAKLEQVVPFEVENLVPMSLEDLAIGSLILPPGRTIDGAIRESKGSEVLVTAAPKDKVAEHLRFLAQADVEPSAVNVDAMALYSVTQFLKEEGADVPNDLAIIDVGASFKFGGARKDAVRTILELTEGRFQRNDVRSSIGIREGDLPRYLFYPTRLMHVMAHGDSSGFLTSEPLAGIPFWPFQRTFELSELQNFSKESGNQLDIDCLILDACSSNTVAWRKGLSGLMPAGKKMLLIGASRPVLFADASAYTTHFYAHFLARKNFATQHGYHRESVDRFIHKAMDAHVQASEAFRRSHGRKTLFRADILTGVS